MCANCYKSTFITHFIEKPSKNNDLKVFFFSAIFQSSFERFEFMLIANRNKHLIAYAENGTRDDQQGKKGISEKTLVSVKSAHWCKEEREI